MHAHTHTHHYYNKCTVLVAITTYTVSSTSALSRPTHPMNEPPTQLAYDETHSGMSVGFHHLGTLPITAVL